MKGERRKVRHEACGMRVLVRVRARVRMKGVGEGEGEGIGVGGVKGREVARCRGAQMVPDNT